MIFSDFFSDWLDIKLKNKAFRFSSSDERMTAAHDAVLEHQVRSVMRQHYPEADYCIDPLQLLQKRLQSYRSDSALQSIRLSGIENELYADSEKTRAAFLNRTVLVYPGMCWQDTVWSSVDVMIPVGTQGWKIQRILPNSKVKSGIVSQTAIFYLCLRNLGIGHVDIEFLGPGGKVYPGTRVVKKRAEELTESWEDFTNIVPQEYTGPGAFSIVQRFSDSFGDDELSLYHVRYLLRGKGNYRDLMKDGVSDIRTIPSSTRLSTRQKNQQKALTEGEIVPDPESLAKWCATIEEPIIFLDFESIQSSVSLYDEIQPWQYIPVMYSLSDTNGNSRWYSMEPQSSHLTEFADSLARELVSAKTVCVFGAAMELSCLSFLSEHSSTCEYRDILIKARESIVDVHVPFEAGWIYFPEQKGKTSLKSLSNLISNDACVSESIVSDGRSASLQYYWQRCGYPDGTWPVIRYAQAVMREIEQYSRNDTLYLYRLWKLLRCTEFRKGVYSR